MTAVCAECGAPVPNHLTTCSNRRHSGAPAMAMAPATVSAAPRPGSLPEHFAAALAYLTVIPAIVFLLTKPYDKNEFVRFHAWQCIAFSATSILFGVVLLLLANVPTVNLLLIPISLIAAIGIVLVVVVCMIKAYQHQDYKLPLLGALAAKWTGCH